VIIGSPPVPWRLQCITQEADHQRRFGILVCCRDRHPSKASVETFLTDPSPPVVEHDLFPSTYLNYLAMVRTRLVPYIGKLRLQDLGPGHIANCYDPLPALEQTGGVVHVVACQRRRFSTRIRPLHVRLESAVSLDLLPWWTRSLAFMRYWGARHRECRGRRAFPRVLERPGWGVPGRVPGQRWSIAGPVP
jgi:hypothetical protein